MNETSQGERRGRVLVVEDDPAMSVALNDGFASEGYEVACVQDGQEGLRRARDESPDMVILDVMLPRMSGLDVCRQLRAEGNDVPIIMLTARGQEVDKVLGLKLGADDYVTKPFSLLELLARVESVLRRTRDTGRLGGPGSCEVGDVKIDFRHHTATKAGRPIDLSAREYLMMAFFAAHRGEVVSRDQLLDAVWGYDSIPFTRTVDTHIVKLRKKIEDDPADPRHLITVHRLGYKLLG
jgi:DNA-binding response OmpR family regulator